MHWLSVGILFLLHDNIVFSSFVILELLFSKLKSLLVAFDICDNIDVGSVHILESSLLLIDSDSHCFVNSGDFDSVTGTHVIDKVLIGAKMDCLWGFTLWHRLRCLLDLHVLLIRVDRSIKVELEGVTLLAIDTESGFHNATHLHCALLFSKTLRANKMRLFHLRNDIAVADHNTPQ